MPKTIFYNAQIITMDPALPRAQALLVEDGRIIRVGTNEELLIHRDPAAQLRDIQGHALLPGFVDAHSHFTAVAQSLLMVNARPSPSGPYDSRELLLEAFRRAYAAGDWSRGRWLLGMGYDPSAFPDGAGITRLDLDAITDQVPIACIHISGHMAVLNTQALKLLGYWGDFSVPAGGTVERLSDGTPSGLITERAYLAPEVQAHIHGPEEPELLEALARASQLYASFGITTAQDARVGRREYRLLTAGAAAGRIAIDVVGMVTPEASEALSGQQTIPGPYENHLRMGGYKIFLDGSPQGKTAWLSRPYHVPPQGQGPDYCGQSLLSDEAVVEAAKTCLARGWQLNAHCNGDAACDQLIRCYAQARRETGIRRELRPVMIHAQTVRPDQLDQMAQLGMTASFFLDHVYYWGDWYQESVLGPERANLISPIRWALERGIPATLHQDSPVVPPNVMGSVHNAVNRTTLSGHVLGPEQTISVAQALQAVTRNSAWQIFEEETKGSIAPGKAADLVILGGNPLTADPGTLRDIPVLETIKAGKTIYKKQL